MQRSFEPMRKQVEVWQRNELTAVTASGCALGLTEVRFLALPPRIGLEFNRLRDPLHSLFF